MKVMEPKNTFNKKTTWFQVLKAMNPFSINPLPLTIKGDPVKKRKWLLLSVRIIHGIYLATIPIAIALIIILTRMDIVNSHREINTVSIVIIFYLFSILLTILGYKWLGIYLWMNKYTKLFNTLKINDTYWTLFNFHLSRTVNFGVTILFAFVLGMAGISWFVIAPLFILAGTALILTFPTDKKWAIWLNNMPPVE